MGWLLGLAAGLVPLWGTASYAQDNGPETVLAVFQGCRPAQARRGKFCTLIAEQGKLYVYGENAASPELMEQLAQFEPGRRLSLSGEIIQLYDGASEFKLLRVDAVLRNRYDRLLNRLQGHWQSKDDPLDEFEIAGAERRNRYAGAATSVEYLSVAASCGMFSAQGPYFSAWDPTEGIRLCYEIEEISEDNFHLMYLPRGNRLEYRRLRP